MQAVHRLPFNWGDGTIYTKLFGSLGGLVSLGGWQADLPTACTVCPAVGVSREGKPLCQRVDPLVRLTWILYYLNQFIFLLLESDWSMIP